MRLESKIQARFCAFLTPVKIMGGVGEMTASVFFCARPRTQPCTDIGPTFVGAAIDLLEDWSVNGKKIRKKISGKIYDLPDYRRAA